jgi:site-specific recombinase XerD
MAPVTAPSDSYGVLIPALITNEGARAAESYINFFAAEIENDHTRRAYLQVVRQFDAWCNGRGVSLRQLQPFIVAAYIKELPTLYKEKGTDTLQPGRRSRPTVKQHLAALRKFFD